MRIAENDKIAFPGYLYLPAAVSEHAILYVNLLITLEIIATRNCMDR
ncbi:Uncharacterised protein [Escherichia coli]|uniref:Uncharacterized protein n=1 Tax=Escherichia coli TaxID=562 RepID=A0A2X3LW02_ECOLX|nr:Uncharacterised protein [Escherichia coli]